MPAAPCFDSVFSVSFGLVYFFGPFGRTPCLFAAESRHAQHAIRPFLLNLRFPDDLCGLFVSKKRWFCPSGYGHHRTDESKHGNLRFSLIE